MAEPSRPLYRIKDWETAFSCNRSRELKRPIWVPWPIKLDGRAYGRLMQHAAGVRAYGVFAALVAVASKCEPRGALVRDDGTPLDLDDLAAVTKIAGAAIAESLEILSDQHIGWIVVEGGCEIPAGKVRDACDFPAPRGEERRREEKAHPARARGPGAGDGDRPLWEPWWLVGAKDQPDRTPTEEEFMSLRGKAEYEGKQRGWPKEETRERLREALGLHGTEGSVALAYTEARERAKTREEQESHAEEG